MIRKLLHIFSFFIAGFYSWGQQPAFQSFTNIIPSTEVSSVYSFAQDGQGLIWLGTHKGLFCYDGYACQQYYAPGEKSNTLIHTIVPLRDKLLLGTDNGLLIYNYHTDSYEEPDVTFPINVRTLALQKKNLWIGTLNGLFRYNIEHNILEEMSADPDSGLPNHTIYSLIVSKDHALYIGTYDGLCRYTEETGRFETIPIPLSPEKNNIFINSLLEDPVSGAIWIGTEGVLYKYQPDLKEMKEITVFNNNSVKSLTFDGFGNLVLATDNGLYVYNEAGNDTQHYVHDSWNDHSLSNNIIWGVFTDREKNLWLATDYGVSLSRFNPSLLQIPISEITGIGDGNRFYSIYKDSHGYFWLGGTNGLIMSPSLNYEAENTIWYRMGDRKYPISHNRIRHIYEDSDRNLWVATDGSINRYDYAKKQFIRYNIVDSTYTLNSNWAYYIFEDNKNQLWIATCLGGIFVVNKEQLLQSEGNYIAERNFSDKNGLSGNFINQIVQDKNENVWALLYSETNFLNKINPAHNTIIPVSTGYINKEEKPTYIFYDSDDFLWCGFRGSISRINVETHETEFIPFDTFHESEVLFINEINENILISTLEGVWVLDKQTLKVRRLNIPGQSFTCSYFDSSANRIYMGQVDEITIISPDTGQEELSLNPVILTSLYVNNKPYNIAGEKGKSIRYITRFEFRHNENSLTFEFSDLVYSGQEVNQFIYQLDKIDKEWNILKQNNNRISYANLGYGKYNLFISKLDSSGKPSAELYTFAIHIKSPWYYTIWAQAFYFLLLLGLVIWIINFFRVKNNLKIERIEKEKTVELTNAKIDFFTNVSHEFKTPLSLIIAPLSRLLLETKEPFRKKQLENIQRNALKINSLIGQVLDFNRMDSPVNAQLILSKVELIEFAQSLFSVYKEGYKDKNLLFGFHTTQEKIYINIDVLKIESVLNNLLSNACKYTPEGGKVELRIAPDPEKELLHITVSDSGIGIPNEEINYIFERYFQSSKTSGIPEGTGIGLYLVKTYTDQHGGEIKVISEENKGTSITISLPLQAEEETLSLIETTETQPDTNTPFILIVDDNPEIADFIAQMITKKYRFDIAHNGKMGLEMTERYHPDLIVADIMMPVMDGLEMSRRIRKNLQTATTPIILLTVKDDRRTELESIRTKADAFIPKPFDPDLLLLRIEQLLDKRTLLEEKVRIDNLNTPTITETVSVDEKFLSEIISIIENKIADPDLNVNALSTFSGIGSKQIYRKIKQLTGLTPVEYIRSIRLKKAAMLLTQKKFTIAEVMYMVGFSSSSYFSKCFQSQFGKTPKQFVEEA